MEGILAISLPIIISLGVFAMIFGLRALENKERMAMIERGMEPPQDNKQRNPAATLRTALFFIGGGIGLLLATIISKSIPALDTEAIYFSLVAIGAGSGLLASYLYDRKNQKAEEDRF